MKDRIINVDKNRRFLWNAPGILSGLALRPVAIGAMPAIVFAAVPAFPVVMLSKNKVIAFHIVVKVFLQNWLGLFWIPPLRYLIFQISLF